MGWNCPECGLDSALCLRIGHIGSNWQTLDDRVACLYDTHPWLVERRAFDARIAKLEWLCRRDAAQRTTSAEDLDRSRDAERILTAIKTVRERLAGDDKPFGYHADETPRAELNIIGALSQLGPRLNATVGKARKRAENVSEDALLVAVREQREKHPGWPRRRIASLRTMLERYGPLRGSRDQRINALAKKIARREKN